MTRPSERLSLIADIGGTNARFALCAPDAAARDEIVLACNDFAGPAEAASAYLDRTSPKGHPKVGAFAVASPVTGDTIDMTNHPWTFSVETVREQLGFETLQIINDFSAIALAIPHLGPNDRRPVGTGRAEPDTPVAVLGPGTGLGVSGLVPCGGDWHVLATEGGHVTMAPFTDRESAILTVLRQNGHVSAEHVISGPGLVNLYRAICVLEGRPPEPGITPETVTERGERSKRSGEFKVCREALDTFCAMLGTVAADLCLSLGARGGVYIAGGIVPKLGKTFTDSHFRTRFQTKGRFSDYLNAVPTFVITHPLPAFVGLAALLRKSSAL
ncbi:MAG: glucokinase [Rhodospirillales bacterium]